LNFSVIGLFADVRGKRYCGTSTDFPLLCQSACFFLCRMYSHQGSIASFSQYYFYHFRSVGTYFTLLYHWWTFNRHDSNNIRKICSFIVGLM